MGGTEIASLYAKVGADISEFSKEMDKVKGEVNGFGKTADLIGNGAKLAIGVGAAAIGGLAAGIGMATSAAADMEQAIADIAATMNLTTEETGKLNGLITDLGLDPTLKVSAVEAADAIGMLGKNGLTMTQIMDGAAKSSILLANATNDDFAMAADVATDVMQQFNIDAADMQSAVDGIIGVTQQSKFGIEDYGLAIAQAGGVAGSVGVSFDDFNAVITATSSSFASGSDAGTSFKTFLQRLVPSSKPAKELMSELGLLTDESGNAFFDASGNMKSMAEIAGLLADATSGLSEEQKIAAFSTIFGTDAMRTAFGLANAGTDTINQLKAAIGNVSAEEAAATRMDTFAGSLEIFSGVMETVTIQIGQAFLPVARGIVEWATSLAQTYGPDVIAWFGQLAAQLTTAADWVQKFLADGITLGDWVSNLPAPLQTVIAAVNGFIAAVSTLLQPLIDAARQFFDWTDALWGLAAVLAVAFGPGIIAAITGFVTAFAPVIGLFAAVALAVAALRFAWEQDWGGIQAKTQAVVGYLTNLFGPFLETITQFGGEALGEIVAWVTGAGTEFSALSAIWQSAKDTAGRFWSDLVGFVTNNWRGWVAAIGQWAEAAWQWIVEAVPIALQKLGEWSMAVIRWVGDKLPDFLAMVFRWGTALYEWIGDVIPKAIDGLASFVKSLRGKGEGEGQSALGSMVSGWAKTLWEWITKDLIPTVGPEFMKFVKAMGQYGLEMVRALGNLAAQLGLLLWEWIADVTPVAVQKLAEWGAALWAWLQANWPDWMRRLAQWGQAAWQWIVDVTPMVVQKLSEWGRAVWEWVQNNAPGWVRQLGTWAKALWEWIVDSWPTVRDKLGEWARDLWQWVKETAPRVGDWFWQMGTDLLQGLWNGIKSAWSGMIGWFRDAWEGLKRSFKNFFGIASPSKLFMEYGRNIGEGFNLGVEASMLDTPQVLTEAVLGGAPTGSTTYNTSTANTFNLNYAGGGSGTAADLRDEVTRLAMLYAA